MPIEVVVSFEDGSSDTYYIPNDYYTAINRVRLLMEPWNWASTEYEFEIQGNKGE